MLWLSIGVWWVLVSNLVEFLILGYSFKEDLAILRSLVVVFWRLLDMMDDWMVGERWARSTLFFNAPPVFLNEV